MKKLIILIVFVLASSVFLAGQENNCFYIVNKTGFEISLIIINDSQNLLKSGQTLNLFHALKITLSVPLSNKNEFTISGMDKNGRGPFIKSAIFVENNAVIELLFEDYNGFPPLMRDIFLKYALEDNSEIKKIIEVIY